MALDSSAVALLLVGVAATQLLRPDLAVPALEQSGPAYLLIGGTSARGQTTALAEAYHQAGRHDRELRTLVAQRALYSEYPDVARFRGRLLRAYAAQGRDAAALALADTMLRGGSDSSGVVLAGVTTGAQEFRAHGRAAAASQLLALARTWVAAHPARAPSPDRQLWEGIVLLASGLPDSAGVRFASVARDSSRLDAAGYLALAQVARGDGARARAAADSLGALPAAGSSARRRSGGRPSWARSATATWRCNCSNRPIARDTRWQLGTTTPRSRRCTGTRRSRPSCVRDGNSSA